MLWRFRKQTNRLSTLWFIIFLMSFLKCPAAQFKPLKPGDHIPDVVLTNLLNYPSATAKISDFKDKILVLDFWATWCSSCINNFPKTYALQKEIPAQLQVLLVNCSSTRDNKQNIKLFLEKRAAYYRFPCIVMDTTLGKMFPHKTIPHYAWIKNNVVVAITDESALTRDNVLRLLHNDGAGFREKKFIPFDNRKLLFEDGNGGPRSEALFQSTLIPYKDGLQNYAGFRQNDDRKINRIDVLNASKLTLLRFAFHSLANSPADRILLFVQNSQTFFPDSISDRWKAENCFSYEAIFPPCTRPEALAYMQADIQKYFHVRVDSVVRKSDCYVLRASDKTKILKASSEKPESNIDEHTGGPVYFHNYSPGEILTDLERLDQVPFLDASGIDFRINLHLPPDLQNIAELNKSLLKQGFQLIHTSREIMFYTVSDTAAVDAKSIHP